MLFRSHFDMLVRRLVLHQAGQRVRKQARSPVQQLARLLAQRKRRRRRARWRRTRWSMRSRWRATRPRHTRSPLHKTPRCAARRLYLAQQLIFMLALVDSAQNNFLQSQQSVLTQAAQLAGSQAGHDAAISAFNAQAAQIIQAQSQPLTQKILASAQAVRRLATRCSHAECCVRVRLRLDKPSRRQAVLP